MNLEDAMGRVDDVGEVLVGNDRGGVLVGNDGGEVVVGKDGGEVLVGNDGEFLVEKRRRGGPTLLLCHYWVVIGLVVCWGRLVPSVAICGAARGCL